MALTHRAQDELLRAARVSRDAEWKRAVLDGLGVRLLDGNRPWTPDDARAHLAQLVRDMQTVLNLARKDG